MGYTGSQALPQHYHSWCKGPQEVSTERVYRDYAASRSVVDRTDSIAFRVPVSTLIFDRKGLATFTYYIADSQPTLTVSALVWGHLAALEGRLPSFNTGVHYMRCRWLDYAWCTMNSLRNKVVGIYMIYMT
jgi:hypothetical protein